MRNYRLRSTLQRAARILDVSSATPFTSCTPAAGRVKAADHPISWPERDSQKSACHFKLPIVAVGYAFVTYIYNAKDVGSVPGNEAGCRILGVDWAGSDFALPLRMPDRCAH